MTENKEATGGLSDLEQQGGKKISFINENNNATFKPPVKYKGIKLCVVWMCFETYWGRLYETHKCVQG